MDEKHSAAAVHDYLDELGGFRMIPLWSRLFDLCWIGRCGGCCALYQRPKCAPPSTYMV